MKRLIVVRHGERIDEVNVNEWLQYCRQNYNRNSSHFQSRLDDPHLTSDGHQQAQEVAERIVIELEGIDIPYIYCSKLIRAVQTAYFIALRLSKPIVVSKGFALTAAAVTNAGERFEFVDINQIRELCPNVEIIDGDVEAEENEEAAGAASVVISPAIPSEEWHHSIKHAIHNHTVSVVVAHRETIRNLAQETIRTPYCCYGVFDVPVGSDDTPQYHELELIRLMERGGKQLPIEVLALNKKKNVLR